MIQGLRFKYQDCCFCVGDEANYEPKFCDPLPYCSKRTRALIIHNFIISNVESSSLLRFSFTDYYSLPECIYLGIGYNITD